MKKLAVVGLVAALSFGLALSWQEGWNLVAKAQRGDVKAVEALVEAYKGGDAEAAAAIGVLYMSGFAYPRDYGKALEYLSWARSKGSGWASAMLALMYDFGLGVPRDEKRALDLIWESAAQGYPGGVAVKSIAYILGAEGKPTDEGLSQAVAATVQAASTGDPLALNNLARLYFSGLEKQGIPRDWAKAARLFEESYAKGYLPAALRLVPIYYYGYGVPPDQVKAVALAERLKGFGSTFVGEAYLASAYYFGVGGKPKDPKRACQLAEVSRSNPQGSAVYGLCLLEGHLPGGRVQGYAWLLKAAGAGNDLATSLVKEWEKRLSADEREQAKRLVADLK